jgi:TRAP-type C4-dicarboxylate transport system permease small subunit
LKALGRRIETALMSVLLLGIVFLAALQIVLRNVFSYSLFWVDDLVRIGVLWLAVIGAVAASRDGRHLAIGLVARYFPEGWHKPAEVIAGAFACAVCGALAWHAGRFVHDTFRFGDTVLGDVPAWPFQVVMPVGFALICFQFLVRTFASLRQGE